MVTNKMMGSGYKKEEDENNLKKKKRKVADRAPPITRLAPTAGSQPDGLQSGGVVSLLRGDELLRN